MAVLNKQIDIKNVGLKSKFFLAPINTGLAKDGNPTNELINFHRIRSNKYTGINYVGNTAINAENVTNGGTLYVNPQMDTFSKLAEEIERHESVPGVQIACFSSNFQAQRRWTNSNPNTYKEYIKNEIYSLTVPQIKLIIKDFQKGIKRLIECGFKAIQIHGAHGYLINNFLSPSYNQRDDEYGKDTLLIIKEILDGLDNYCRDVIVDLRISLFEEIIANNLGAEQIDLLNKIYSIPAINIISISNGIYNINKKLIYPEKDRGNAFLYPILRGFILDKKDKIWNISGNVNELDELYDHDNHITYSIGRPIIADSDFLVKSFEGRNTEIVACKFRNKCHYFSLNKSFIECGVNPNVF